MSSESNNKRIVREFGLSSLSVDNRTSVIILVILIIIMGGGAYTNMPKESFPEIKIPKIYVGVPYPGNSPLDIENLILRPIEKEVNTITGVTKINSNASQDYGSIMVEFDFDSDVAEALLDVKDAVDKAKSELPTDLDQDPNVFEIDFSEIPVLNVNISGGRYSHDDLKYYAEYLEEKIENLKEVSSVELKGAKDKEVRVSLDRNKMAAMDVAFKDVEDAISRENKTVSGGDLLTDEFRRTVRLVGEFEDVSDLEMVTVKSKNQKPILLRDIAEVRFDYVETESYSRTGENAVITLEVKKRSGENLLIATDKIKAIIVAAKEKKLPADLVIDFSNDQSRQTRLQVENLENSIISGVILVVLVLMFFLGLRNALFVGVAIPLSMLTGFIILNATGNTLNIMVLFSLILSLGMLVDNGIVVVENIYRLMSEEGMSPIRAAKEGVGEVAWPIISSTLTTLAAFFPLLFWSGIMGEFMKFLPITLIIVLASSLFVALVVNPVLTSMFMKSEQEGNRSVGLSSLAWKGLLVAFVLAVLFHIGGAIVDEAKQALDYTFWGNMLSVIVIVSLLNVYVLSPMTLRFREITLPRLESAYDSVIRWALHGARPKILFLSMFVFLVLAVMAYFGSNPNVITFPENQPNYINVFIELPTGTDIERTNRTTAEVEKRVNAVLDKYETEALVESFLTNVGKGTSDPNTGQVDNSPTPHKARITVSFVEFQYRTASKTTTEVMEEVRRSIADIPGVQISVDKDPAGPPMGPPISIEISGEEYPTLMQMHDDIMRIVQNSGIEGIEELKSDLDDSKPEVLIIPDRQAIQRFGLSTAQVAGAIRTGLFGKEVSKFKEGEDEYPINIRFRDEFRYDLSALMDQRIPFKDQSTGNDYSIPVSALATVKYSSTLGAVKRKDLDRVITLYSNVLDGYNPKKIIEQLDEVFADYNKPEGYEIRFTGEIEEQEESMAFLQTAFILAVFLIFLIIVTQFNSISAPIIILCSVMFSTIGVMIGLTIFQMDFVVIMMMIGIISLAGVVVNNAIVLIDYTNLVRDRRKQELGMKLSQRLPKEEIIACIIEAGKTRLRPVLLTAITTVLGLIPLAVGFNINFASLMSDFDPQIYIGGDNVVMWGPMSWTVIYGLSFATFLTLVIVPVMYLLFDRLGNRTDKIVGSK